MRRRQILRGAAIPGRWRLGRRRVASREASGSTTTVFGARGDTHCLEAALSYPKVELVTCRSTEGGLLALRLTLWSLCAWGQVCNGSTGIALLHRVRPTVRRERCILQRWVDRCMTLLLRLWVLMHEMLLGRSLLWWLLHHRLRWRLLRRRLLDVLLHGRWRRLA